MNEKDLFAKIQDMRAIYIFEHKLEWNLDLCTELLVWSDIEISIGKILDKGKI